MHRKKFSVLQGRTNTMVKSVAEVANLLQACGVVALREPLLLTVNCQGGAFQQVWVAVFVTMSRKGHMYPNACCCTAPCKSLWTQVT